VEEELFVEQLQPSQESVRPNLLVGGLAGEKSVSYKTQFFEYREAFEGCRQPALGITREAKVE
jgi:hypothetical protein